METAKATVSISVRLPISPMEAYDAFIDELVLALTQIDMRFETGENGCITTGEFEVGHVVVWKPGELIRLEWRPADWNTDVATSVEARFEPIETGTLVTVEQQGWERLLGDPGEVTGWFAGALVTPFLRATTPQGFGDWLTDRRARRPSGAQARNVYSDPLYHYPNFKVILQELALSPDDYLVEVGCGGGALLAEALTSGCRAAAVDHSADMIRLAQQKNHEAINDGRLTIQQADAAALPFSEATFTCGAMTGVLGFLPDPVAALRELWRVLRVGGRLVVLGAESSLRGTPAAPEPMASRLLFYEDDELQRLAEAAGFAQAQVVRRDLLPFARQVGVPDEHLSLFAGAGAPFLLARKG